MLSLLTAGIVVNNGTHGGAISTTDINNGGSSVLTDFLNSQPYNSSQPKAFLNWVIVDEEFKKVTSSFHMGAVQVPAINSTTENAKTLVGPANMTVRRNGWLYVYLSNESNQDVYFDDLIINHKRGPVVEANNYYAFGLEIPGLGSKAVGFGTTPQNRIKFEKQELQSKEFSDGSGLETYEFKWRMDDPQIGRFWSVDPLADKYVYNSSYAFSENKVTSHVELEGLEGVGFNFAALWRSAGISSSTDPKEYVTKNFVKPAVQKSIEIDKFVAVQLGFMFLTGGLGELSLPELMASRSSATSAASGKLGTQVFQEASNLAAKGKFPATVVGAESPTGATAIKASGNVPNEIAPALADEAKKIGGVGAINSGNKVGCCSEFHAANELMLKDATLKPAEIKFTPAIRPRTMEEIKPCENCQALFPILKQ